MDSKNPLLHTLLDFAGNLNTVTVHRAMVDFLDGHFEAALLLEQMLYWTPKAAKRDGWVAKSFPEWREEIYLSRYAVEKARKYLKGRGLLEWEIRRFNNSPTAFYRLNLNALAQQWEDFLGKDIEVEPEVQEGSGDEAAKASEEPPAETDKQPAEGEKAPAEISRWSPGDEKAPAEISRWSPGDEKAPAEISRWSPPASKAPAEISRPPAEISKSLTEITTETTLDPRTRKLTTTANSTRVRGGPAGKPAVAAAANPPEEIRDALKALGWAGSMREVAEAWQQDPDRVRAWVEHAQRKGWSAALLRAVLREDPGYPPREPDPAERYLGGYAPSDEARETKADAPSPPEPPPDLPASVRQWWTLALGQLRAEMPKAAFDTWVRAAFPVAYEEGDGEGESALTVGAANAYACDWLSERLTKPLEHALSGYAGKPVRVKFVVQEVSHV